MRKIPPSELTISRRPLIIKGPRRVLVLSDIHVPFHDTKAIKKAVSFGVENGATDIYLNGDLLDFYSLSNFAKDPRERNLSDELETAKKLIDYLRDTINPVKIWYKVGNHEDRFERYLKTKAPELLGVKMFSLKEIFEAYNFGVDFVESWRVVKFGNIVGVHGHEVGRGAGGLHPARWLQLRTQRAAFCGHFHKTDTFTSKDILGDFTTTYALGCLCDLQPDYLVKNNWNHGAGFIEIDKRGRSKFTNLKL